MAVVDIQQYNPDSDVPPPEVIEVIESGLVNISRRVEFYLADGITRWYPDLLNPQVERLIGGGVTVDYGSDERRKLDLTLDNIDNLLRPDPVNGFWYDKVIKVFRGVVYDSRDIEPKMVVVESDDNNLVQATAVNYLLRQAGFAKSEIKLGSPDGGKLKGYSWIVSGNRYNSTAYSAQLKALFDAGKNIITFGTANGVADVPHYVSYNTVTNLLKVNQQGATLIDTALGWVAAPVAGSTSALNGTDPITGLASVTTTIGSDGVTGSARTDSTATGGFTAPVAGTMVYFGVTVRNDSLSAKSFQLQLQFRNAGGAQTEVVTAHPGLSILPGEVKRVWGWVRTTSGTSTTGGVLVNMLGANTNDAFTVDEAWVSTTTGPMDQSRGLGPVTGDTPTKDVFKAFDFYQWLGTPGASASTDFQSGLGTTITNLCTDPSFNYDVGIRGWIGNAGTVQNLETVNPISGAKSQEIASVTQENWGYYPMNGDNVGGVINPTHVVGQQYTAQVKVRSMTAQSVCLLDYGDSNTQGPAVTLVPGIPTLLTVTFVAGTNVYLSVRNPNRSTFIQTPLVIDEMMIETGAVAHTYFDGDSNTVREDEGRGPGPMPTAVASGVQPLSVWSNGSGAQFITAALMTNYNGAVWIDIRLPSLDGSVAKKFLKTILDYVRDFYTQKVWETQLGEFFIDNIGTSHFPNQVKVTARDGTKKMMNDKLSRTVTFAVGTRLDDLVIGQAALAGIPVAKMRMNIGGEVLSTELSYDKGTTRWDIVKGALNSFNYEFFFDNKGNFVVRPFNDPYLTPSEFSFGTGPDGNLVTFDRSVNDSRIYNVVQVTAVPSDGEAIPVTYFGEARNDDPNSPTNTMRLGNRVLPIDAPWLTSDEDCAALALTYLKISALESYEMNFQSIYYAFLEAGAIVDIFDPDRLNFEPTRFLMDTIDYPLDLGPMGATAKRVTFVGEAN